MGNEARVQGLNKDDLKPAAKSLQDSQDMAFLKDALAKERQNQCDGNKEVESKQRIRMENLERQLAKVTMEQLSDQPKESRRMSHNSICHAFLD